MHNIPEILEANVQTTVATHARATAKKLN